MPRITVDLQSKALQGLVELAERNRREPREQAAYLIERAVKRAAPQRLAKVGDQPVSSPAVAG